MKILFSGSQDRANCYIFIYINNRCEQEYLKILDFWSAYIIIDNSIVTYIIVDNSIVTYIIIDNSITHNTYKRGE